MMLSTLLLVSLFLAFCVKWFLDQKKLPPGPKRIPLLGSIPFITTKKGVGDWTLDEDVTKPNIATVQLGLGKTFVINNFDLAKDLFSKEEFSGRRVNAFLKEFRYDGGIPRGIIHTQGSHWNTQRRFSLKTLKDFGFGKQSLETAINTEIDEVVKKFSMNKKEDIFLQSDFNVPIINILWQMIAGYRFTEDKEHEEGLRAVESVNEVFSTGMKLHLLPLPIAKIFPEWSGLKGRLDMIRTQNKFFSSVIQHHQETLDEENPRDFIDVYLTEMNKEDNEAMTLQDLSALIENMFIAGTDTSSTTLKWIILHLCLHQDVQTKCREEILKLLGHNARCSMANLQNLPYTLATITEVQRVARVAPMSLFHATSKETKVNGYTFPKGSMFVANLSHITHDPKFFKDPHVFKPERWISEDGRFVKNERLIPFGIGKRTCMGELLARNEIFLFTVNLIQKLSFRLPSFHEKPSVSNYNASFTRIPDDFYLRVELV